MGTPPSDLDVVDLHEVRDFRLPAVAHKSDMDRMVVVGVVGRLIRELHREAELEAVLGADLLQPLEALHRGYLRQHQGILEKLLFFDRALTMLQGEDDGVADHGQLPSSKAPLSPRGRGLRSLSERSELRRSWVRGPRREARSA